MPAPANVERGHRFAAYPRCSTDTGERRRPTTLQGWWRVKPRVDDTGVCWPALIRQAGEDELLAVSEYDEWLYDADLSCWPYDKDDRLIDSAGRMFVLEYHGASSGPGVVSPEPTGTSIDPEQLHQIVLAHLEARHIPPASYEAVRTCWHEGERVRETVAYVERNAR